MEEREHLRFLLIQVLDKFVEVCEAYNLKYYLAYGSVLGAVRHQGIIPWDDDIDVVMPRADYEKLYSLEPNVWGTRYKLCSYRNTLNYVHDFMKVEDMATTLIEIVHPVYVGGVYVDIFPLDNIPNENEDRKISSLASHYASRKWYFYSESVPKNYLVKYVRYNIKRMLFLRNNEARKWDELTKSYWSLSTESVKDYHCAYLRKSPLPKTIYGAGVKLIFEGKQYIVPEDYHAYLKHFYGNYMEFPPLEKRNSGHDWKYLNLTRRLNTTELEPILRQLVGMYSYSFCLKDECRQIMNKLQRLLRNIKIKLYV